MTELESFLNGSKTFASFTFVGCYDFPKKLFYRLYYCYLQTGKNYLDVYSELTYLKWEMTSGKEDLHNYEDCLKYDNYIGISIKMDLFDFETNKNLRKYVRECRYRYGLYIERLANEPRKTACKFTSMPEIKSYVFEKYGKKCLCCGSEKNVAIDHIIPINKGGENKLENLQPLCKSCNSKKGVKIIDYRHE